MEVLKSDTPQVIQENGLNGYQDKLFQQYSISEDVVDTSQGVHLPIIGQVNMRDGHFSGVGNVHDVEFVKDKADNINFVKVEDSDEMFRFISKTKNLVGLEQLRQNRSVNLGWDSSRKSSMSEEKEKTLLNHSTVTRGRGVVV